MKNDTFEEEAEVKKDRAARTEPLLRSRRRLFSVLFEPHLLRDFPDRSLFHAPYRNADLAHIVLCVRISQQIVFDVVIRDQLIVRCREPLLINFSHIS